MAGDPVVAKYSEKMVDSETAEPIKEQGGCFVEFYMEAEPDPLLTEGGEIEKKHPKVKEIRRLEQENLALLRQAEPFTEEEPAQPKDQSPPVQRAWKEAHDEWDARRVAHDTDLKERATLLRDHHEHKDVFVVSPAGRPIFVDREYVRIIVPGDKDNMPERPVREEDKRAYPQQYDRFKKGLSQAAVGTPLEQWPGVTKAQCRELAHYNIRTVEHLAGVSDSAIAGIGPITALRKKAQDWLATSRGMAPVAEARAEAKRLAEELAELKRQMAEIRDAKNQQGGQQKRA